MKIIEYLFESNIFNLCLEAILTMLGSLVISRNTNRNTYTEKIPGKKISAYENIYGYLTA